MTNPTNPEPEMTLEQLEAVLEPVIEVDDDPRVSLRHPKWILREADAVNFVEAFTEADQRLDETGSSLEAIKADFRKQAEHDGKKIENARPEQRPDIYSDCHKDARHRLESANAIKGCPLEGIGATIFYDVYLSTLDSYLEKHNILVVAPRDLRQFGEPVRTLEDC